MRPRVLILARANPAWTQFYIEAFRRVAEVRVAGPPLKPEVARRWFPTGVPATVAPDVSVDFDAPVNLRVVALADFEPDLVVGISGLGGDPLPESMSAFACPTAYITVDTWQCILNYPESRQYDYVFAAQREFVPRLNAIGARNVQWLPLACAPDHHYPIDTPPDADVAFAGSLVSDIHTRRRAVVEAVAARHRLALHENAFGDEACRLYARGRLGLNHCAVDEINMRVFEVMAMKRPLLVNRGPARNGLLELFEDARDLVLYDGVDDVASVAARYLADSDACRRIAHNGYEEVLSRHTYDHRVAEILRHCLTRGRRVGWRDGTRLVDCLPHAPGRVLDVGMRLDASRYALRHWGATELVGIARDNAMRNARTTSYDSVIDWPPQGSFDTVVVSALQTIPDGAFWEGIAAVTPPGGTLIVGMGAEGDTLEAHLRTSGFVPVTVTNTTQGPVTIARRATRTVRDVVHETFAAHPETGYDPERIAARVPPDL